MPGKHALMAQFGAGRVTIRPALKQLASDGLITREPGRGTRPVDVVAERRAKLTGLLENLVSMGPETLVKVLEVRGISASSEVADALQIKAGSEVQKAVRVLSTVRAD